MAVASAGPCAKLERSNFTMSVLKVDSFVLFTLGGNRL